jgi:predicted nucleic acid-binding protein
MFTIHGASVAQTLTVEDVEALPGTTGKYVLKINVGDGEYTGFQFDIQYPATGFSTPSTGKSTVNASWIGGSINPGDLTDGKGRVSALSMSNDLIPAGDIEIGTVSFNVADDVSLDEYDVTISNFEFLSGTTRTPVSDVTFKVKVVNALTVILDDTSTTLPENATGVNVVVKRTIKANDWSTICLPFEMSEEQVKAAFGEDVELADFTSWSSEEDDDGNIVSINIDFTDVTEIEANHPYIIKVTETISKFNVDGVDIEVDEEPVVQVGKKKAERGYFTGCYVANTEVPENNLFLSENKFWYSKGLTKMKAFRGFFELADVLTAVEGADSRISMSFDNQTEGIKETSNLKSQSSKLYDLQGRRVVKPGKGLYIQNGRKVIK